MSSEAREVVLEVYLNGVLYSSDSYFAFDDKDVQLEFEITDAIYDLLDPSTSQEVDVTLQVETIDQVSVRYCSPGAMQLEVNEIDGISVCEVDDLQLEMNRPTESTAGRMFKKMKAFSQRIRAFPQRKTQKSVGQPEVDDLDPEELCFPDPRTLELEPEIGLVDTKQFCIPELDLGAPPEMDLGAPPEPKPDTVDPQESYVSLKESTARRMFKKMKAFSQKIRAFPRRKRQKSFGQPEVDDLDPEESCVPEPEMDLGAPSEPKLDSVDPKESSVIPKESIEVMKISKVCGFVMTGKPGYATVRNIKKISVVARPEMHLSVPEPEPEEDPVTPSVAPKWQGSNVPEPEPECKWDDVVDSVELCAPGPSVPQPRWDLAIPEPESKVDSDVSRLENYIPLNMFQLEDRLKQWPPLKQRHVNNVWSRVFIGDEDIARDRDALQEMCITHILNAAAPKKDLKYYLGTYNNEDMAGSVNTGSRYYRGLHINYYGLPTADRRCSDISKYFMPAAKFIDKALDKRESKVLICCKQGVGHSATLFLAYLMICHDMMLEEAIDHVMKSRRVRPSRDALKKLMLLNADLVQQRKLQLPGIKAGRKRKNDS